MSQFSDGATDPRLWEAFKALEQTPVEDFPFLAKTLRTRQPVVINDPTSDRLVPEQLLRFQLGEILVVPLIRRDEVIGAMALDNARGAPERRVKPPQVNMATTIATQVALVIENAQLHDGLASKVEVSSQELRLRKEELEILAHSDLTKERRLEAERRRAAKLQGLGQLAGGIAHDFNNILTGVMSSLSMAELELEGSSKARSFLYKAQTCCNEARHLTKQLLTFSKGGAPIKRVEVLGELIREASSLALHGSKVRCDLQLQDESSLVEVDRGQLGQVIQNLALNAAQAMPDGGVIEVRTDNFEVHDDDEHGIKAGSYARIVFRDHGVGISRADLARIFDPYFTTKKEGTGLGLATTYSIIEKHGGRISVDSEPGLGTTFEILLPATDRKAVSEQAETEWKLLNGGGTILVMDDEESICEILSDMLVRLGYEVTVARNGQQAVDSYRRELDRGRPFEMVILDLTVAGGMGGLEAMRELRRIDPNVQAVVSSGYSEDSVLANYERYSFCAALAKPYKLNELGQVLHSVLSSDNRAAKYT